MHRFCHPLLVLVLALSVLPFETALGHDPGWSTLLLSAHRSGWRLRATFNPADAHRLLNLKPAPASGAIPARSLSEMAPALFELRGGGRPLEVTSLLVDTNDSGAWVFNLQFESFGPGSVEVRSPQIARLPFGHRQALSCQHAGGPLRFVALLDAAHPDVAIPIEALPRTVETAAATVPVPSRGSFPFLALGVEHILTGFDHLVFLLGLLVATGGLRPTIRVITGFTIGHSLTLALATLDLIRLPPAVVEPLIAASLIYVGVENILSPTPRQRVAVAGLFGLLHGLGFASALRDLGIGAHGAGVVAPLFAFNLGVETGQLAVAALVWPGLVWMARHPRRQVRWSLGCSLVVSAAGACWLAARLLALSR